MAASPASTDKQVVTTATVACDGNGAAGLGHPRIFLTFGDEREIVCPYCSRTFVLAEGAKAGHGH